MNPTITCHITERHPANGHAVMWRPPSPSPRKDGSAGWPYRTCSYCGSMHPADLLAAIQAGARMHGSDWKYGWPHKFYVKDIPNPQAGAMVRTTSGGSYRSEEEARKQGQFYMREGCRLEVKERVAADAETLTFNMTGYWDFQIYEPDGPTTHGKWYNDHLRDEMTDAEFRELADVLEMHAGIVWVRDPIDKRVKYSAPSAGYQR